MIFIFNNVFKQIMVRRPVLYNLYWRQIPGGYNFPVLLNPNPDSGLIFFYKKTGSSNAQVAAETETEAEGSGADGTSQGQSRIFSPCSRCLTERERAWFIY